MDQLSQKASEIVSLSDEFIDELRFKDMTISQKKNVLSRARILYFADKTEDEIAKVMNCAPGLVELWVWGRSGVGKEKTSFFAMAKDIDKAVLSEFYALKSTALQKTGGMALSLVHTSLNKIIDEVKAGKKVLSVMETKLINDIFKDLHKGTRLENDQVTEIVERRTLSASEARDVIANDPFAKGVIEGEKSDE